jgi:hypothetical protein
MANLGSDGQEPNPQDVIKQARYLDLPPVAECRARGSPPVAERGTY